MAARKSFREAKHVFAMLGASKVGKSSLLNQLIYERFSYDYDPTTERDVEFVVKSDEKSFLCLFLDTFGGNDFPVMRRLSINKAQACIVVFALDDPDTLTEAKDIVTEVRKLKADTLFHGILLVGNKKDTLADENLPIVSAEAQRFCDSMSQMKYVETSAKCHKDLNKMLFHLLSLCGEATDVHHMGRSPSLFTLYRFDDDSDTTLWNYKDGAEVHHKQHALEKVFGFPHKVIEKIKDQAS